MVVMMTPMGDVGRPHKFVVYQNIDVKNLV